jgi:hypothetical protein
MSEKTRSDWISASIRWSACCDKTAILDIHEVEFLEFIETTLIDDLSEELIRWLSTILF